LAFPVSARPSAATKLRADELKIDFLVQQGDNIGKRLIQVSPDPTREAKR